MYLVQNLNKEKEIYKLDQVNCMEKPIAIMLDGYNQIYRHIFHLFMKMMQSYNLNYYKEIDFSNLRTMSRVDIIMNREMNIKLKSKNKFSSCEDFCNFIDLNIQANNPVVVPANLKELYYSKFYLKNDWYHSFLVYDHDKERGLFHIFDSVQTSNPINYDKFVIQEKVLYDMYKSFNENLYEESVYYIDSSQVANEIDVKQLVINCLNKFVYHRSENVYIEVDLINKIISEKKINQDEINKFRSIYHHKEVFFYELSFFFQKIERDVDKVKQFNKLKENLLDKWDIVSSKIIYKLYHRNIDGIMADLKNVLNYEESMRIFIKDILNTLNFNVIKKNCEEDKEYSFINNEDNIITKISERSFKFCFNNNKLYNNWFKDESPKIIYNTQITTNSNVEMSARFCLDKYETGSNFIIGFIFNTNSGENYLFGLNSGVALQMEHTSVDNCMLVFPINSDSVEIKVNIVNKHLHIICKINEEEKKDFDVDVNGEIKMCGVCCKTWMKFQPLILRVEDLKISIK